MICILVKVTSIHYQEPSDQRIARLMDFMD